MSGEPICPMTPTGQHQKRPWQASGGRSGLACKACHKTWTWRGEALVPTHQESSHD
jgi:hypothetical protein